ncbi:uncharacterized protein EAE97_007250 [Botrytis byssoidea]|uniref:Ubiquitin 3 binding protein But2 C-terminal domain-containing protein n=1 Tax=Botrytis byssoidea TaxID=139641 RepID=A0A9P5IHT1_9HELO|nr:uncharacterized protein EAE97_007250 [Botrytis byssoidea]KAF7939169.1 hypothetical protein EAE97_007250 [Botrytis byssoidea]
MFFTKPSVIFPLFLGASLASAIPTSELVARTSGEVLNDYESIPLGGIPGVMSAAPITTLYNQLSYSNFYAVRQTGLSTLLIKPNGNQAAVGNNASTLTSVYAGSPVVSFKPNSAYFGCVLNSDSAVSPAVSCTVEVTAYRPDGTPYADKAGCSFDGGNTLDQCTFPTAWTTVGKLSYQVIASQILTTVGPTLGSLLGSLSAALGTVLFYFDDFNAVYTCIPGKTNAVVGGLCG